MIVELGHKLVQGHESLSFDRLFKQITTFFRYFFNTFGRAILNVSEGLLLIVLRRTLILLP